MNRTIAFLCFLAALVIFVLLGLTAITWSTGQDWGLALIAGGLALGVIPVFITKEA